MRIVSGSLKSRRIQAPTHLPVRPTTDFAKESLFNILNNRIDFENVCVLDLFAGIGSISFEFASRGAVSILAIDQNPECVKFIQTTSNQLNIQNIATLCTDVFAYLTRTQQCFDLVFADPPYDLPNLSSLPDLVFQNNLLNADGYFVLEHSNRYDFSDYPHFCEVRKYGKVHFSFFHALSEGF